MPSGLESSVKYLRDEHCCSRLTHSAEHRQTLNLVPMWKAARLVSERQLSICFDLGYLAANELVMTDHPFNVATQEWWQSTTVTGHHRIEEALQPFVDALAAEPNTVQREQPLYPANNTRPLLNKVLPLTLDPLGIFLLDRRNAHSSGNGVIPGKPSSEDPGHLLGVKPICLGEPTPAWFEKARRVEYYRANASSHEQSREPKSVVSHLVTKHDLQRTRHVPHGPRPAGLQNAEQAIHVTGAHLVNTRTSTLRWGERADPSRLAEFERYATHVVDSEMRCHDRSS
jgi:hypothetical protein